jgi:hypothetical protein
MNSVLKSHFLSTIDPSWEDGEFGAVVACYVRYISSDGTITEQQFKEKAWYRPVYEKYRLLYQAMRDFFVQIDASTNRDLSHYQNYKVMSKYLTFAYREAAKGNQYLDHCYLEFDKRRAPDDRLGCCITIIGDGAGHEK